MKKYIVITTINPKSLGISKFESMNDWHVIVVGDKKSVNIESSKNLTFLSVEDQRNLGYQFTQLCPCNHYARKNIGYLYAIQHGADIIYDTDDDNIPYDHWQLPEFVCNQQIVSAQEFVNVYKFFTDALIWPRGFPLEEIRQTVNTDIRNSEPLAIGTWQSLADLDPDVDAIYRLIFDKELTFDKKHSIVLGQGSYCPFNSQNTFWQKKAFPYLYLPATTSFRFTDILRGYIAQQLMWKQNLHLGFTKAMVYQERNVHDLMRDFSDEVECYLNVKPIIDTLASLDFDVDPFTNIEITYQTLAEQGFVKMGEVDLCKAWIEDARSFSRISIT
ncbi:MAG: DUF288 domain-containing protein [Anaerolineales bacterium]|nr:DUF288 domain-containing protein [Anaerolineales bacterium]